MLLVNVYPIELLRIGKVRKKITGKPGLSLTSLQFQDVLCPAQMSLEAETNNPIS